MRSSAGTPGESVSSVLCRSGPFSRSPSTVRVCPLRDRIAGRRSLAHDYRREGASGNFLCADELDGLSLRRVFARTFARTDRPNLCPCPKSACLASTSEAAPLRQAGNHPRRREPHRMETFTIREAAERTGRTEKAIRNLCDRGKLRYVVRDGRRRIIALDLDALPHREQEARPSSPEAASEAIGALVARLEAQAVELATLRALTVEAESLRDERERLEADLIEARATITSLEARLSQPRRRWFRRAA